MNIHLGTFINNEVEKIRELSESEYNEYNRHWENLQEVKSDFDLLLLLKYNYQAFFDNIQAYLKHVENENLMHFEVEDKFKLEVNRHFLNFLSSFKTFLDHSETSLKRRFGKESDEVKRFKQACSEAFDSHFEYRFFYRVVLA